VLIGLSAYYYYYYCRKIEKFAEAASAAGAAGAGTTTAATVNIQDAVDGLTQLLTEVGSGNIPEGTPYVETLATVPSSLKFYLTSFSQRTKYDNGLKVYLPEMQRWYNFVKANQSFFVKGASADLTASVYRTSETGGGMRLKNVALEGLRSDELNTMDYSLKSFSATFFMTFANTTPPYNIPANCEIFTISLESPNYARLTLINNDIDDSKCNLVLQIGENTNKITTNDILKSDLITTTPVSITITSTIGTTTDVKANIFITKTSVSNGAVSYQPITTFATEPSITLTSGNKLLLGNSRMSINKNQTALDANLLAFMFFSKSLTSAEHDDITTYLAKENIPETGILSTLNTAATSQLETIRRLITDNTATQGTLQQQLNACKATVVKEPVVKAFGHLIKMDGISDVTSEDLRSCSILEVKKRLTKAVASAAATTATGGPRFQINMPQGSASNVTPVPPS
jgi:hypothetical protein